MKILIQAVIDIDPETRGEALAGARGWIEGALAQPGCLAYAWTLDPHVATRIHVFEEWDGEAALAAHLAGPQYRGMLGHIGEFGVRASSSRKFAVSREGPVYNSHGVASAAFD
ncbi:MAG TPA: putative quinol monooxygenase [Sphingopyxis sp.]|jgi:quinol monooxygenase YgiN|uniref:putative quinol monooxygenase n=1 Tax=Sphingopyxis sp. TaxID=1908224 RepID=UPI002BD27549|nr:putative quinol monooxygenase [Sphingopyxis sp.]HWW59437.1 putative quinol monooxygenase [Sphingopyxis sp.]